ncbi:putative endo-1,3-beta-glucanase [Lophium mytilinum]|uniref:glucan endo-1,3-beta-D-glucosidase n=1 Tax=Lophium mytilinum TaxID=390894 RepID=A0A6A6QN34_9PEZI|nr:putative endo-1,3-beta-glucanase [Lophium mytilinum]
MASDNLFTLIDGSPAPPQIPHNASHPAPRTNMVGDLNRPLQTNKFYANWFLGSQTQPVWTHPYSLQWVHGGGNAQSWGMGIVQLDRRQIVFSPDGIPHQYYLNPIGIHSMILSATELGPSTTLTTDNHQALTVNANLCPAAGASPLITVPVVQGAGMITGVYKGATPSIQSHVQYRTIDAPITMGSTVKYRVLLEDNNTWLIYVTPNGTYNSAGFQRDPSKPNTTFLGPAHFNGIIQIVRCISGAAEESIYDRSAGVYATGATITASASVQNGGGTTGSYTFIWSKGGNTSKPLIMFALPHHVDSFDPVTAAAKTSIRFATTSKGFATAIQADRMTLLEPNLPEAIDFGPTAMTIKRSMLHQKRTALSSKAISAISSAAADELNVDMSKQCNLDSMYFSGKGVCKFAMIVWTLYDLANNPKPALYSQSLDKLKVEFDRFVQNKQAAPLTYDESWRGVITTGGYKDPGADFGNTYYNDHHFHYGYFVYAAAIIATLDPAWLTINNGQNKVWVNMLVKDFANSYTDNPQFFPFSRSFDWWMGHSWAKGLFESGDGKDQESTSEDALASLSIKMWGKAIGDKNMEMRGNLMLAIQARTFPAYFLLASNNTNQPAEIIGNKVTGILFENKVDHATYFGTAPEFIQGIHMLPISPATSYIRSKDFVNEEWNTYFSNGRVDSVAGGWRGVLWADYALVDPKAAYNFFAKSGFDYGLIDGGASRTWYLAFCAALGGAE